MKSVGRWLAVATALFVVLAERQAIAQAPQSSGSLPEGTPAPEPTTAPPAPPPATEPPSSLAPPPNVSVAPPSPSQGPPPTYLPTYFPQPPPTVPPSYAGRFGFEAGIVVGKSFLGGDEYSGFPFLSNVVGMRIWASDKVVVRPAFRLSFTNPDVGDTGETSWELEASTSVGWVVYKGKSTRLVLAPGLRVGFAHFIEPVRHQDGTELPGRDTTLKSFGLPASFELEQKVSDRFALVVGARTDVLTLDAVAVRDSAATWSVRAGIETAALAASIVFYTD